MRVNHAILQNRNDYYVCVCVRVNIYILFMVAVQFGLLIAVAMMRLAFCETECFDSFFDCVCCHDSIRVKSVLFVSAMLDYQ